MSGVDPRVSLWEGGNVRLHPLYLRELACGEKGTEAVHGVRVRAQAPPHHCLRRDSADLYQHSCVVNGVGIADTSICTMYGRWLPPAGVAATHATKKKKVTTSKGKA